MVSLMRKHHESTEQMRRGQYHGYRGKRYPGGVNEMPGKARDGVTLLRKVVENFREDLTWESVKQRA